MLLGLDWLVSPVCVLFLFFPGTLLLLLFEQQPYLIARPRKIPCVPFVFQSSYPMRMNRCNQILKNAISLKKPLEKFIGDANRLTDKLLELCNKPVKMSSQYILKKLGVMRLHLEVMTCNLKFEFMYS